MCSQLSLKKNERETLVKKNAADTRAQQLCGATGGNCAAPPAASWLVLRLPTRFDQSIGGLYRCRNRHQAFCRCRFNECKVRDRRNQLVTVSQTTNVHDLRAYNEARDQYGRWLVLSDFTLLKTKVDLRLHAPVSIVRRSRHTQVRVTSCCDSQRGGLELITEFQKSIPCLCP